MEASARAPEDLYGLPLEEFTPARDALAKELKAAGHKDEAAEVKRLRKPSLAAWALNRVARDHPEAIGQLREAGADLRAAQDEALSGDAGRLRDTGRALADEISRVSALAAEVLQSAGRPASAAQDAALSGDAGRLRDAGRALAEEIDRVATLAAEVLQSAGRPVSAAQQEKLASTLRTAAIDDEAGEVLTRGVLVDDLEPTGFSLLGAGPSLSPARPSGKPSSKTSPDGDGRKTLPGAGRPKKPKASKEELEAVDAARRVLRRCDAEAEMAATRAKRRAERAEAAAKRAAEAQREAEEARAAAEDAAGEAEAARRAANEAADRLSAAEAALPT